MATTVIIDKNDSYAQETQFQFYKRFFLLCAPIIFQQLLIISLSLVDNIMVGQLGVETIAAVSFANKIFVIYLLSLFGAFGGITIFMAQYFGKKDYNMIRKLFGLMIIVAVTLATSFTMMCLLFPESLIRVFSRDAVVVTIGTEYLWISSLSFPFLAITIAVTMTIRTMGHTVQALYITVIITMVNAFLNYCLIYGNFGFPTLGAKGAAMGTVIARALEVSFFIFLIFRKKFHLKAKLKRYFGLSKYIKKKVVKISIPVFFTELLWVVGTSVLTIAYALKGTEAAAAIAIADLLFGVSSIVFMGIANGSAIVVAQSIGAGNTSRALIISKYVLRLTLFFATVLVILSLMLIKPIVGVFNIPEETQILTHKVLLVMSFAIFFKTLNWAILIGIIRAGGDTTIAFLLDIVPILVIAIPIAFIAVIYWDLPVYIVLLLANLEEVIKAGLSLYRYKSRKWIHDLTVKNPGI